jgi:anti-anti-sigma factor
MKHSIDSTSKTLTLSFDGDVLSTNADVLRQDAMGALDSPAFKFADWQTLKLDLTAAKMIDSVGLNLIVSLIRTAKSRSANVVGLISNPSVQRALVFTRLNSQMDLVMVV